MKSLFFQHYATPNVVVVRIKEQAYYQGNKERNLKG
jgi:hypothetical protein